MGEVAVVPDKVFSWIGGQFGSNVSGQMGGEIASSGGGAVESGAGVVGGAIQTGGEGGKAMGQAIAKRGTAGFAGKESQKAAEMKAKLGKDGPSSARETADLNNQIIKADRAKKSAMNQGNSSGSI